jgi:hypothetical protein
MHNIFGNSDWRNEDVNPQQFCQISFWDNFQEAKALSKTSEYKYRSRFRRMKICVLFAAVSH